MIAENSPGFSSATHTAAYNNGTLAAWEAVGVILQLLAGSIGGKDEVINQLDKVLTDIAPRFQGDAAHREMFLEPLRRLKSGAEVQRDVTIRSEQI